MCARVYLSLRYEKNEEFEIEKLEKKYAFFRNKCLSEPPLPASHRVRAAAAGARRRITAPNPSSSPLFLLILEDIILRVSFLQPLGVVIARGTSSGEDNGFLLLLPRGEGTKALWCGRWRRRQKLRVVEIKMATMRTLLLPR